jgi:macrolide transport system ATP-binding/permease protein
VPLSSRVSALCRNLFRSLRVDRDLDDEIRAAFDLLVDEKIGAGLSDSDARRAAALELGGVERVKLQVRETRAGTSVESVLQDVGYAFRGLRRSPLFTLIAVLSLGIGIAGNAVVFNLVDVYLLRNRPGIADPERLAEVGRTDSGEGTSPYTGDGFDTFSYPNYLNYRERQSSFEALAAYHTGPIATFGLGASGSAVRVPGAYVSANYFSVLGVTIALGRGFLPEEEQLGSPRAVAVISDRLWQTQFGGDRSVLDRPVYLNGRPFTIVGVAAPAFTGYSIDYQSLWLPITAYPDGDDLGRVALRGRQWLMGIGRLKPGVTIEQARADMARIGRDLEREYPDDNRRHGVGVEPAGALPVVGRSIVGRFQALLFALVGLVLLIACFNVAGMLLARGVARGSEIRVRLALGAATHRIVRLLVIESLVVSAAGALGGLAGGWAAIRLIERAIPLMRFDITFDLGIDWRVVAFSCVLAIVTGLICGIAPARAATRVDLTAATIRDGTGSTHRLRARSAVVVAQVALSVLLVVCALLFGRSLRNAGAIDPGFVMDGVEVVGLNLRLGGYDDVRGRAFVETLMARIESLPGLDAAASARVVPLTGEREGGRCWRPDQYGTERAIDASQNIVTPGYFRTIGLPLLAGRNFTGADRAGAPAVAIVNETLARRAWPGDTAVGKRLAVGDSRRLIEIVGVVRDAKYRTIGEAPTPFFYVPAAQRYETITWVLMRPAGPSLIPQVRALVREMDPNLPLVQASTLADMSAFTLFPARLAAWLAAIAGTIGVLLAALGVYGIAAYNASQRTREIGIRVALGAVRGQILRLIVGQAGRLAAAGTALGLAAAALVTRLLEGLLYGVRPLDAISFAGGAVVLGVLALIASLIPASRAASVNPVDALRTQ